MVACALFAALTAAATAAVRIPLPVGHGYYHAGDAFIYLAAACLPQPYAAISAAVGASFADLLSGFTVYIPFTFFIKALMTLAFTRASRHIINLRNILALAAASFISVAGYYAADAFIAESAAAVSGLYGNAVQAAVGGAVFLAAAALFDKAGVRGRIGL